MKEVVANNESQVESKTAAEGAGAQTDDLDSVLSEIDKEFEDAQKATKEAPEAEGDPRVDFLIRKETETSVNEAVDIVKKSLDEMEVPVSARVVRSMLNNMALEDPRIKVAFDGRYENPARWQKILKNLGKEIASEFNVDHQLTNDRKAVEAAIRGSKTATPEDNVSFDKFMRTASDSQIDQWKSTGRIPESFRG